MEYDKHWVAKMVANICEWKSCMPCEVIDEPFIPLVMTMNATIQSRDELKEEEPDNINSFDINSPAAVQAILNSEDTW